MFLNVWYTIIGSERKEFPAVCEVSRLKPAYLYVITRNDDPLGLPQAVNDSIKEACHWLGCNPATFHRSKVENEKHQWKVKTYTVHRVTA